MWSGGHIPLNRQQTESRIFPLKPKVYFFIYGHTIRALPDFCNYAQIAHAFIFVIYFCYSFFKKMATMPRAH